MKELVRSREDPTKRSQDRQHWHEEDERDKLQRRKFWIHIVFDILLVAATAYLARDYFTTQLRGEVAELQTKVARLEKRLSSRNN